MNQTLFLETSSNIGAQLCRDAIWAGSRCNWLGPSMEAVDNSWKIVQRSFGPDVYSGTSGIALFLGYLFQRTNERIYRWTASGAIRQALSRVEDLPANARFGFYTGITGIAYTAITLGELVGEEDLIPQGLKLIESLKADLGGQGLDLLSGYAGVIPALLSLYRRYPEAFLLDLATRCGEQLVLQANRGETGWSWNTMGAPQPQTAPNLTGFSHGTAGIGWALFELAQMADEPGFRTAAEQAFEYERYWFNEQYRNWPDFRGFYNAPDGGKPEATYMVAWCHGAAGIGFSRLRAFHLINHSPYRADAEIAIQTTIQNLEQTMSAQQGNYSLCHGLAGNAELLLVAAPILENESYRLVAERVGNYGAERYFRHRLPWPSGLPGAAETPGLMLGLAGTGYFFLRLADESKTPSILVI